MCVYQIGTLTVHWSDYNQLEAVHISYLETQCVFQHSVASVKSTVDVFTIERIDDVERLWTLDFVYRTIGQDKIQNPSVIRKINSQMLR